MKIRLFSIAFLLFIVLCNNSHSQQDVSGWYWMNGQPTGNTLRWVKIMNSSLIYATGEFGTFMKSTDGGDSWMLNSQVGSPDNSPTGGGSTRVLNSGWFVDANTGVVGGQSLSSTPGYVSRTTNGGDSWNYIQYSPVAGTVNGFYFINSNTGYLCGNSNAMLYKTTDRGQSWNDISGSLPSGSYTSVFALNENQIFLTTSSNRVIKTTNAGASWGIDFLPGSSSNLTDIFFKDANTGYVTGNGVYFAYTTNGGSSWTQSNPPSIRPQYKVRYFSGNVYIAGDYNEIYRSSNDGANWTAINFVDASNVNQPAQFIIYGMDVNASDIAVVGIGGIVNISNDEGASWRNKNYSVSNRVGSYGGETYSSMFVQSANGNIWLGPNGGGAILHSTNGGDNWTRQPTSHTTGVYGIDFVNSTTGFICGGNAFAGVGEFSKTTNGGVNWITGVIPTSEQLNSIDFIDANTGWIFGGLPFNSGVTIAKTTDGGSSWTLQYPDNGYYSAMSAGYMIDANSGYAVGGGFLFKTTNGGNNWIASTNPYISGGNWSNMFMLNKDIIYLNSGNSTGTKRIIRTTDGGQNWTDLTANILDPVTVFRTRWLNLNNGIVAGTNGYFAKTSDGGQSWIESNPGGSTIVAAAIPEKNTMFAVSDRNSQFEAWRLKDNQTSITVNPVIRIEGFWNGTTQITDTVTCYLRSSVLPYFIVAQTKSVINIGGYATFQFNSAPAGSYYIQMGHRNALDTWSSSPVTMTAGGNYNYDFTSSPSMTYGNNVVFKNGKYCFYSGEINKDGSINLADIVAVANAATTFTTGYVNTDLDGNNINNLADITIVFNNAAMFVQVQKP